MLKNQNVQVDQTFPFRKRFRSNNVDEPETLSNTMDTNEHPTDFLSESDLEESETDVANELEDSITDLDISLTNTDRSRKRYLKSLEKYNEVTDEDKPDIFKKYVKLKGNLWMNWYNYNEEEEENNENESENESESKESESEPEGVTRGGQECGGEEGEDGENQDQENEKNHDKNHLIDFVLQLESVANEDDKTEIERLWNEQLKC